VGRGRNIGLSCSEQQERTKNLSYLSFAGMTSLSITALIYHCDDVGLIIKGWQYARFGKIEGLRQWYKKQLLVSRNVIEKVRLPSTGVPALIRSTNFERISQKPGFKPNSAHEP